MDKKNYTSLELSRWLYENGCELKSDYSWDIKRGHLINTQDITGDLSSMELAPAYDILNDICVKYVKEFWTNDVESLMKTFAVFRLFQQGKKQEAEDYIKKYCKFNSNNLNK